MNRETLLRRAMIALVNDRSASLADVAAQVGVSRTTLHRRFATREVLLTEVARFALDEVDRIYDAMGVDDEPVIRAVETMGEMVLDIGAAYTLLWAQPFIVDRAEFHLRREAQDERFERFAARGQADRIFRTDMPAGWVGMSIAFQASALSIGVRIGYIRERGVQRLFVRTALGGVGAQPDRAPAPL